MPGPAKSATAASDAILTRMWNTAATMGEIGDALGVSHQTVRRRADELNLPTRAKPAYAWTPERDARARPLYESGIGAREAAAAMGDGCTVVAMRSRAGKKGWKTGSTPATSRKVKPDRATSKAFRPRAVPPTAKILADVDPVQELEGEDGSVRLVRSRDCRFPVGASDPERMDLQLFCCAPAEPGIPYCGDHARCAYPNWGKQ